MFPGEHVGGGFGIESPVAAEPPDEATADSTLEGLEVGRCDRASGDELDAAVGRVASRARCEHAIRHAGVEMDVTVEVSERESSSGFFCCSRRRHSTSWRRRLIMP